MRCYIDTETTGLKPEYHEIIEIAIICENEKGEIVESFISKIKPEHIDRASDKALQINGYNDKDWRNAPSFEQIANKIRLMLDGCIWIGHRPQFDYEFIQEAFFRCGCVPIRCRLIDTTVLVYEHLLPLGCDGLSMDSARRFLFLDDSQAHTAGFDAKQTRDLYHKLARASWWRKLLWRFRAKKKGFCKW
jgi:DNA polymerase III epsilon subunit-like protein